MGISRASFLKYSILGGVVTVIPGFNIISGSHRANSVFTTGTISNLHVIGKELFYKREYDRAETHYKRCIADHLDQVVLYDGLNKVYGARHKHLEQVELFRQAWLANPEEVVFYDRLANALRRLSLASRTQEIAYVEKYGTDRLIEEAAYLYLMAINLEPTKAYLRKGLLRVNRGSELRLKHTPLGRQNIGGISRDTLSRTDAVQPEETSNPKRLRDFDRTELIEILDTSKKLTRRELHFEDEKASRARELRKFNKRANRLIYRQCLIEGNDTEAEVFARRIRALDPSDTDVKHGLRRIYIRQKRYSELESLHRDMHEVRPTYWSALSLGKALILAGADQRTWLEKSEAEGIFESLISDRRRLPRVVYISAFDALAKCHVKNGDYERARLLYVDALAGLGVEKRHLVNTLIIGLSNTYRNEGRMEVAANILLLQLGQPLDSKAEFAEMDFLSGLHRSRGKATPGTDISLLHALASVYDGMNRPQEVRAVCESILAIQPKDVAAQRVLARH